MRENIHKVGCNDIDAWFSLNVEFSPTLSTVPRRFLKSWFYYENYVKDQVWIFSLSKIFLSLLLSLLFLHKRLDRFDTNCKYCTRDRRQGLQLLSQNRSHLTLTVNCNVLADIHHKRYRVKHFDVHAGFN